jgi:hypothetical protein
MARGLMVKVALNDAARKGCQTGVLKGKSNADIISDATDVLRDNGFGATQFNPPTLGSVTVTVTDPSGKAVTDTLTAPADSTVSVQVAIPVASTLWLTTYFVNAAASQSETVVMKKQ